MMKKTTEKPSASTKVEAEKAQHPQKRRIMPKGK